MAEFNDVSRRLYHVELLDEYKEERDLMDIAKAIVDSQDTTRTIGVFFWSKNSLIGAVIAEASIVYAPNGNWEDAHLVDAPYKFNVEFNEFSRRVAE